MSKTCTTFPRQVNAFENREEYSLAACCPAVVDFLKEQDKIQFILESEVNDTTDFLFNVRKMMLAIIQDNTYSVSKSMLMIFDILLGINQKQVESVEDLEAYSDWRKLQSMSDTIDKMQFNISDTFLERNELFLDLVENYRKQGYYTKYLEPIAKKAEKLEDEYDEARILSQIEKFEKVFAPYNKLFRNYVASETFASCLMPGGDLESMIVAFQWIAMEYATMMHSIFLEWAKKESESLEYSMVRDHIVVIARVTGYDADDVWEYLEESFESIIWDWGYLALVVGDIN